MSLSRGFVRTLVAATALAAVSSAAFAESDADDKARIELSGFAMIDTGYDFNQNDPDWFDVMRPSKLPAFKDQFGKDGRVYSGVRQSRLGVKSWVPTKVGELYTIFEFELFGVGVDAGQTTFRLRHAYGELGQWGAGQTWSPFMDIDVFPNSVEYWGPNGMVFFRNVQLRWMPLKGEHEVTVALERPGASGDQGTVAGRVELAGIQARFQYPDLSAHYRWNPKWGHIQASAMLRSIKWDDLLANTPGHAYDLSGSELGWGMHVSANVNIHKDTLRTSVVFGEGIENYMNDAPVDVGVETSAGSALGITGKALPMVALVAFYDRTWSDRWTSTIGYSMLHIDNSDLQAADAFKTGHYALVNALYHPLPFVMLGPEFQWGRRVNNSDDWQVDDYRIQFSVKCKFGHTWRVQ